MGNLVSSDAAYKKSDIYTKKEVEDGIKEIVDNKLDAVYTKQEVDDIIKNLNTVNVRIVCYVQYVQSYVATLINN